MGAILEGGDLAVGRVRGRETRAQQGDLRTTGVQGRETLAQQSGDLLSAGSGELGNAKFRIQNAEFRIQNAEFKMQNAA